MPLKQFIPRQSLVAWANGHIFLSVQLEYQESLPTSMFELLSRSFKICQAWAHWWCGGWCGGVTGSVFVLERCNKQIRSHVWWIIFSHPKLGRCTKVSRLQTLSATATAFFDCRIVHKSMHGNMCNMSKNTLNDHHLRSLQGDATSSQPFQWHSSPGWC